MKLTTVLGLFWAICLAAPSGWAVDRIVFNRDIKPILSNNCFECHGPDDRARKRRPRFDTFEGVTSITRFEKFPAVPGDPDASEIIKRITSDDEDYRMPPADTGKTLTDTQKALLSQWIAEGAKYQKHWSYITPEKVAFPEVSNEQWVSNGIDAFILARLDQEGLHPASEAAKRTLIRRVSLDLTGLPPSPEAVEAFVKDDSKKAYERVVDDLLKSPAYGERWAQMWLDLARYADTKGYEKDDKRTIWKFRDWVIRALNDDMPYTQFTIEQIAGDLLEDPTEDQIVATAFHRNTMNNDEGGTDDEEFRTAAVVDRVNTTMQVWMGTTMGCAQCHAHKYDPISMEEYYRFYAFFNQTADVDNPDERPTYWHATEREKSQRNLLDERLSGAKADIERLEKEIAEATDETVKPPLEEALKEANKIKSRTDSKLKRLSKAIDIHTPIMQELPPDQRRTTHILSRGSFLSPGDEVTPGTPEVFPPFPADRPMNRLGLAYWLVSEENPLTARVTVNRYWEQIFGAGLVTTSEEFGTQGAWPSHPKLLDWLAVTFMEEGWSLKDLCKTIVMSSTYRQSSRMTPAMMERDPRNVLLARGPRFRLDAEVLRDQALAVSGLLSEKMYGASVMPFQPDGVWQVVYSGEKWETSAGEDSHRRGLYTYWRRTAPYPSMMSFDAGSREVCLVRRIRTNTPLQALVTLNDPVYVEAAQALARRVYQAGLADVDAQVGYAMELALGRPAIEAERLRLAALYEDVQAEFAADTFAAEQMATSLLGPVEGMPLDALASLTVVCNSIMNLDEFLTKR